MFVQLSALPVTAVQKLLAMGYSLLAGPAPTPATATGPGTSDPCALARASRTFIDQFWVQIKNALPVWIYYALGAAIIMLFVGSITGRLNVSGRVFMGVLAACFAFSVLGVFANIVAPQTCH